MKDTKNIVYKPKKVYKGFCSIRSYIVEKAVKEGKNLIVDFKGEIMTIPNDYLSYAGQLHKKSFKSKFSNKEYFLYDFPFEPDKLTQ